MDERHNLGAKKKINAQSINHTSNKNCTMLFIPEGYIRNQNDYKKYPRRKVSRSWEHPLC